MLIQTFPDAFGHKRKSMTLSITSSYQMMELRKYCFLEKLIQPNSTIQNVMTLTLFPFFSRSKISHNLFILSCVNLSTCSSFFWYSFEPWRKMNKRIDDTRKMNNSIGDTRPDDLHLNLHKRTK